MFEMETGLVGVKEEIGGRRDVEEDRQRSEESQGSGNEE